MQVVPISVGSVTTPVHRFFRSTSATTLSATSLMIAIMLASAVFQPIPARATTLSKVTALRSDSFVEASGVNIHSKYSDTAYRDVAKVRDLLRQLGVRHVRDYWSTTQNPDGSPNHDNMTADYWKHLAASGVGVTAMVGHPDRATWSVDSTDASRRVAQLADLQRSSPGILKALEGPNEWDLQGDPNWRANVLAYQKLIFEESNRYPELASLPVIAPSVYEPIGSTASVSAVSDQSNLHMYVGSDRPEVFLPRFINDKRKEQAPGKPVAITEAGYTTGYPQITWGLSPVSEAAQAVYMPRLLAEHFRAGASRTFLYELLDTMSRQPDGTANWPDSDVSHFGLVREDYSPKPAFTAIQRLHALLSDPSATGFTPGSLEFEIAAPPGTDVHTQLLQKSDGTFRLLVWRADTRVFQGGYGKPSGPLTVPDVKVSLEMVNPTKVEVYKPNVQSGPVKVQAASRMVDFNLGPELAVLNIFPVAQPILCPTGAYADRVRSERPTVYLRLGEQSGSPVNGVPTAAKPGAWSSAPVSRIPGTVGDADGSVAITGGQNSVTMLPAALSSVEGFTIEAWVKPEPGSPNAGNFLDGRLGSTKVTSMASSLVTGQLTGVVPDPLAQSASSSVGSRGVWRHAVQVYAGKSTKSYVDGRLVRTEYGSRKKIDRVTIGAIDGTGFRGVLDEVAVYPTKLAAKAVTEHYCLGETNVPPSFETQILADKPSGFFRLGDLSASPADSSGAGATAGPWSVRPTSVIDGPVKSDGLKAVQVNGEQNVNLKLPAPLETSKGLTIEAWAKFDSSTPDFSFFLSTNQGPWKSSMRTYSQDMYRGALGQVYGNSASYSEIVYPGQIAGGWHHIVLVMNGASTIVYLDGNGVGTTTDGGNLSITDVTIGRHHNHPGSGFTGALANVAVYPRALTFDRVAAHYRAALR
jgi:hypothetical protein